MASPYRPRYEETLTRPRKEPDHAPFNWHPEVRKAQQRADRAERTTERLGQLCLRLLTALSTHDPATAKAFRAEALEQTHGQAPAIAGQLDRWVPPRNSTNTHLFTMTATRDDPAMTDAMITGEILRVLESADPAIHLTLREPSAPQKRGTTSPLLTKQNPSMPDAFIEG